ncbi:MAG TPA: hypothetical protein DCP71_16085 [Verrucomicrobiales bacterium]|nr:hypothetical protein [Verrucomicrobiales bacterium]
MGISAGLFSALFSGALLNLLATLDVRSAVTANADMLLRNQMWVTSCVSLACILPSILCGFIGGLFGARILNSHLPTVDLEVTSGSVFGSKWITGILASIACLGLAVPLSTIGRPIKKDPAPVVVPDAPLDIPPTFRYSPPKTIKTAKVGTVQPDITKTIENVSNDAAVSLSPDGNFFAYVERSSNEFRVIIFDLTKFEKVGAISIPSSPQRCLAWSPDQKALACAIENQNGSRRVWILKIDSSKAVELPRPSDRDLPGGDLFWWQDKELIFFPDDEPSLVLDLDDLNLGLAEKSAFLEKADETTKLQWTEGPRIRVPKEEGWAVGLKTLIRSAAPASRHNPDDGWKLGGDTVCALTHPNSDVAMGFSSLGVKEGMRILCVPDGSKIIRIADGRAEVTYMKVVTAPEYHLEVTMPVAFEEVKDETVKLKVELKKLCAFIYAPLENPLTNEPVGPNYGQIKALARILEWRGKKAVFIITTFDRPVSSTDVIASLHAWDAGSLDLCKIPNLKDWWEHPVPIRRDLPSSELEYIESPVLLTLSAQGSSLVVVKASEHPRPAKPKAKTVSTEAPVAQLTDSDVKAFLTAHHDMASKGDVAGMVSNYDSTVDFLDKGRILSSAILAEESAHRVKWPKGMEKIISEIVLTKNADGWNASYSIEFSNENAAGEWHRGKVDLTMAIGVQDGKLRITSQRAKVYDVQDSKSVAKTPEEKLKVASPKPQGIPVSVPRPYYVTTTMVGDRKEIEITDHISFMNGLHWHRTYRELSKDGKELNTCRAIYECSGGVSQGGQSASLYVKVQGWAQNYGQPKFLLVCERSAAAFVGREFNFQFTNDGMIEQQGIRFQLRK